MAFRQIQAWLLVVAVAALFMAGCATQPHGDHPASTPQIPPRPAPAIPASPPVAGDAAAWEQIASLPWPEGGQYRFANFEEAKRIFWSRLYPAGGTDLYCGTPFDRSQPQAVDAKMSVEHVFPADAIAENEPGCTNRTCANTRAQRAMADLQNLWPALQRVNSSRSNLRFGELPDDVKPRFPDICPAFRRGTGAQAVVEPRDSIKGDVARSLVYMHFVYGLRLEDAITQRSLLTAWMRRDPPDAEELRRNRLIDQLQGTANPLLDPAFLGM